MEDFFSHASHGLRRTRFRVHTSWQGVCEMLEGWSSPIMSRATFFNCYITMNLCREKSLHAV